MSGTRLTSVTLPGSGGTVSFKYDPFGWRIYKSSSSGTSIYAYDGDNLIEETNSSGAAVARYSADLPVIPIGDMASTNVSCALRSVLDAACKYLLVAPRLL